VRIIHAGISGLVRWLIDEHASVDELVDSMPGFVAPYGVAARLVGQTPEAIEFDVASR